MKGENKTKVLLLSVSLNRKGGVTNYINLLIQYLNKDKFQVKHFVQGKSPIIWKNIFLPFVILTQLVKFKRVLKTFQPDVVHINSSLGWTAIIRDFTFMKIAKKDGFPVLFFLHGWEHTLSRKFKESGYWRNYFEKRFALSDAIVVLAKEFKEELVKLGISPERIKTSTTMVESDKYRPEIKEFNGPIQVLFCSRIEKAKGIYELLNGIPIVLKKYSNTKFVYMGNGGELENLQKKIKEMDLSENVKCVGYKSSEEKIGIYKNSHIFAFPTYYGEGFPNVFCEAMGAGLSIITTPIAGLADAMEDGKQGFLIKSMPPKSKEIAEKIIKLMKNAELMNKMSENNLKEAKEKYDVKVVARNIGKIYSELVHSRKNHGGL